MFDAIEGQPERIELNLYVTGYEDDPEEGGKETAEAGEANAQGQPDATGAGDRSPSAQTLNADEVDSETTTDGETENA